MASYIEFIEIPTQTSTKVWQVRSKSQQSSLGLVKWWGHWWQYCFFPERESLYSAGCLRDIAGFCEQESKKKKAQPAMIGGADA